MTDVVLMQRGKPALVKQLVRHANFGRCPLEGFQADPAAVPSNKSSTMPLSISPRHGEDHDFHKRELLVDWIKARDGREPRLTVDIIDIAFSKLRKWSRFDYDGICPHLL